jgi:flagellar motor protein MotB
MTGDRRPKTYATARYVSLHMLCIVACCLGCNRNPYGGNPYWGAPYAASQYPAPVAGGAVPGYAQPQLAELERRVQQLDMNNRQLTTQLAQSQQLMQVSRDQATLLQKQLQDTTSQLQQTLLANKDLQGQTRGLQASITARGGATLRPNTSGQPNVSLPPSGPALGTIPPGSMPPGAMPPAAGMSGGAVPSGQQPLGQMASAQLGQLQVPGASVQSEGSVIRIRVPADQLFAPGTGQLNPAAYQVLDNVATAILRNFSRQRVAIEGHTDSGNMNGGAYSTQYQLATVQAQAVMDQLIRRNTLPARQLAVVAHGPNYPRGDNQSPAGRAENRRIEFVVYPETF